VILSATPFRSAFFVCASDRLGVHVRGHRTA
jgi:hypothetical protein